MGVEQSGLRGQRPSGVDEVLAQHIFRRAMLEALSEAVDDSGGMTSAQIEHAWDPEDCSPAFRVLRDHLTARRLPSMLTTDCIRGKKAYITGRHVWEINWDRTERGMFAVVGVATPHAPLRCLGYEPLVGSNSESWGWNLSNKQLMHAGTKTIYPSSCPGLQVPDSIYVILDMNDRTLSFSTKDTNLGVAFKNLPQQRTRPLCLIVSAVFGNCDVKMTYMGSGDQFLQRIRPLTGPQPQAPKPCNDQRQSPTKPPGQSGRREVIEGSSSYKFHHARGSNVVIMCGGKQAKRMDALDNYDNGIVISSTPLKEDELFEVRLDDKVGRWLGAVSIGATQNPAEGFNFPDRMVNCREKTTFMWCDDKIKNNGNDMTTVAKDLNNVRVGDRVGVMRKSDNSLHFFLNGVNIGKSVKTIPAVLYGVVDVYGQAEKVTLTGGTADTQTSNQERESTTKDPVSVKVRMNNAVELLKDSGVDMLKLITVVSRDISDPYSETADRKMRQNYGDHLAEIGGATQLTKLLKRLIDLGLETKVAWFGMQVVRTVFWNYCDASLKMGKAVARSGVLSMMLRDLDTYGPSESKNEKRSSLVLSAVNILHNCAKATENRQVFRDLQAVERLVPFVKAGRMEVVVVAILTLSYITDEEQKDLLEADSKLIGYLIGMLRNAVNQPDLRGKLESSTWSALEIAVGLGNIAVNDNNKERMIEQGVVVLFIDLMNKGGDMEQECAANALWALAKVSAGRAKIRQTPNAEDTLTKFYRHGKQSVQEAARRVLLQLKQTEARGIPTQTRSFQAPTNCEYQRLCKTYKDSLNVGGVFFDTKFDRCYCTECHSARGEKLYYTRGKPAKDYGIPVGWCRFGLKVPHRAEHLEVFAKWHVAFHGTRTGSVKSILEVGDLLIPGDVALGGKKLQEEKGHFNDDRKPAGFDTKQIFVSPSVRYSGNTVYAKAATFEDSATKKRYDARVVLQVCIRPDSYNVGPQTIGATAEIDPKISNQEIEWFTKERGSIIIYGMLIKMDTVK